MKILFVITGLGVGGAERQIIDLADRFVCLGHQVRIVCLTGDVLIKSCSPDIRVESIQMSRSVFGFLKAVSRLRSVIGEFRPDVVHSHMVHANLLARITRLFQPMKRLVCTAHNSNEGGKLRMLAYRYTDFLADVSTNVSEAAVSEFVSMGASRPGRMVAVYNGIDLSKFAPLPSSGEPPQRPVKLLAVGRFFPQKDYPCLLDAVDILRRNGTCPEFQLEIAGDGPERSSIEAMATQKGIADCIQFLGVREDIPQLMQQSDIFVLSSAYEGFGLVVAEAMACEKVVVATDCGGVKEVLGGHGFLVPPRSPEDLAEALNKALCMDRDRARAMGNGARRHVEEAFGLEAIANRWLSIYVGAK